MVEAWLGEDVFRRGVRAFIDEHRYEGEARVARKVRRSILTYLYREEKVVEGPTLRAPHRHWTTNRKTRIRSPGRRLWRYWPAILRPTATEMVACVGPPLPRHSPQ